MWTQSHSTPPTLSPKPAQSTGIFGMDNVDCWDQRGAEFLRAAQIKQQTVRLSDIEIQGQKPELA